jgi:hypothetical protein
MKARFWTDLYNFSVNLRERENPKAITSTDEQNRANI